MPWETLGKIGGALIAFVLTILTVSVLVFLGKKLARAAKTFCRFVRRVEGI